MKALAAPGYGPLARIALVDAPLPEPGRGEVRVRVVASALNPADYKVVLGTLKMVHARSRPLFVGYDFSGTVDAVGPATSGFAPGDEVFGFLPYSPWNARGAFAEHLVARCDEIAKKPPGVSHAVAAAAATTGVTALQAIRDHGRAPKQGARVLVTGASGGVGSIAIGVARRLGARVAAVGSGAGLALARRLGAEEVVDRTARRVPEDLEGPYDVVLDASATYRWSTFRRVLAPGGAFVTTMPSAAFVVDKLRSLVSSTRVTFIGVKSRAADLQLLGAWLGAGLEVPLADTIAVRDVASGLARLRTSGGRIAVQVAGGF
jgi:NADPH:quinone reductase